MRLELDFPRPWVVQEARGDRSVAVLPAPPGERRAAAVAVVGPMGDRPDEPAAWIAAGTRADLTAGASLRAGPATVRRTAAGWPYHLVEAEVRGGQGETLEARLVAFYQLLDHAAIAMIRLPDAAQLERHRDLLLAALDSGRPDWRGDPIALAEAWDLRAGQPGGGHHLASLTSHEEARQAEAVAAWTAAIAADARNADAHYNLAQARLGAGDHGAALAGFRTVLELEPDDVMTARKVIQCLYGLGRVEEGEAARRELRVRWAASPDPRVRLVDEYVFDQIAGDGFRVQAVETLRPERRPLQTLMAFRAVDEGDGPLPAAVLVETSEQARAAGTPFVVAVQRGPRVEVRATWPALPPYPELRRTVLQLIGEALGSSPA